MITFRKLLVASLKEFFRDRTSSTFTLILPLLFVAFFGFAYHTSTTRLAVGVTGPQPPIRARMDAIIRRIHGVSVESGGAKHESDRLHDGSIDVLVVVGGNGVTLQSRDVRLLYDAGNGATGLAAPTLLHQIQRGITGRGPIEHGPAISAVTDVSNSRLDFVVPGLLAMAIMWLGIFAAIPLVQQREQQVLRRIAATPLPVSWLMLAQVLGRLLISVVQTLFIFAAAKLFFGVPIGSAGSTVLGSLVGLIGLVLLGALSFVAIGYAVAALSASQHAAHAWAQLLTVPMLLLCGVVFPIDAMPGIIRPIAAVLPLTYLADGLRQVSLQGQHIASLSVDLGLLAAWTVLALGIAVRLFRWS